MRHRSSAECRGSYIVLLDGPSPSVDALRDLAAYLSQISLSDFEVVTIDASDEFDRNRQILRWVGRHIAARPQHFAPSGSLDRVRAPLDVASCDKVIVADASVRYSTESLDQLALLLELHEVVEPQDYFDPLPWWGGIEAGRTLVRRSISTAPLQDATFGFRKRPIAAMRSLDALSADGAVRRLALHGAEVFAAAKVFVRRLPPAFSQWVRDLPRQADEEFAIPVKAAVFFMLIPIAIALTLTGGLSLAAGYAATLAFLAVVMAVRGRIGAGRFFPWRACFFAPFWLLQRSLSIYWALLWRVSGGAEPRRVPVPVRARDEKVATGK